MKFNTFYLAILFLLSIILISLVIQKTNIIERFESDYKGVDIVYYINLDHREDRKREFLEEMKKANIPSERIERISATYKKDKGDLGCSMSHIETIERFINSSHNTCIVFEDDFEYIDPEKVNYTIQSFLDKNIKYDVCLLSGNVGEKISYPDYSGIQKIKNTATTSGYMVKKEYAPTLLTNFKEGCELLKKSYEKGNPDKNYQPYAIDQYWKKLQEKDDWFVFDPKIGRQRKSFSDIMGGEVNYKM